MEIYYKNSAGEILDLMSDKIYLPYPEELLSDQWSYTSGDRIGNESEITEIYKNIKENTMTVEILADNEDEFHRILNKIHDVTERDVGSLQPGRIYYGEWYKECYMISKDYTNCDYLLDFTQLTMRVLNASGFWNKEVSKTFVSQKREHDTGFDYPMDYPFDYTPEGAEYANWKTGHHANSEFVLHIYGPCTDPIISVNGYPYQVYINLEQGEQLAINSKERTIVKKMKNGKSVNAYNSRRFTPSVFGKIPGGDLTIAWNGDFEFAIKLYLERSEPKWKEKPYLLTESGEFIQTSRGCLERQNGDGARTVSSLEEIGEIKDDALVYIVQDQNDYKASYKDIKGDKTANALPADGIARVGVMYFLGRLKSLRVGFEDGKKTGDMIYLTFESGNVEPDVTFTTNNHTGLNDINLGRNFTYEIIGIWNGNKWMFAKSEVLNE